MAIRPPGQGSFFPNRWAQHQAIVDFFSLFYSVSLLQASAGIDLFADSDPSWRDRTAAFLNGLRREDGGFAKAAEGRQSSTYHTFLVMLVLQLIDRPIEQPEKIVGFLSQQLEEDGGWREIKVGKRAGTNPSAAAAAVLKILDAFDESLTDFDQSIFCWTCKPMKGDCVPTHEFQLRICSVRSRGDLLCRT